MSNEQRKEASNPSERSFPLRLQRFLARSGVASRRRSEDLMSAGRVTVNGVVVTELGFKVDPQNDLVAVDGAPVVWKSAPFTLVLAKPAGYLTTMSDPQGRPCVAELVPISEHPGLFPVGRLDRDTTGVLLFTTDGDLGQELLHPSKMKPKRYVAVVEGIAGERALRALRAGIELEDGLTAPAKARTLSQNDPEAKPLGSLRFSKDHSLVELTIHEGKTHQVKRMLKAVGLPVVRLHRSAFGPIELKGLAPGTWRELDALEREALYASRAATTP